MIGYFDYTVILTYLSLVSAMTGIIISAYGSGHPYMGCFFLLFSGLCDTFDGIVARSKPNRTEREKCFGMQIDSLVDLVAFGVLPGTIAVGLFQSAGAWADSLNYGYVGKLYSMVFYIATLTYVLAAMIRLAYFNVLEIEQDNRDEEGYKRYVGLPVTAAALVFPLILLINRFTARDYTIVYFAAMPLMSALFLGKFSIRKPSARTIAILLSIGAVEFFLLLMFRFYLRAQG